MKFSIAYIYIPLFLLLSCGSEKAKLLLDNPTKKEITVKIGDKTYSLQSLEDETIELAAGKYPFETKMGDKVIKGEVNVSADGVLNLTESEYIIWEDAYYSDNYQGMPSELQSDTILVDSTLCFGDLRKIEKDVYFIPKAWDYDVHTPFPDTIEIPQDKKYVIKRKIFRKKDFLKSYNELYEVDSAAFFHTLDSLMKTSEDASGHEGHEGHSH